MKGLFSTKRLCRAGIIAALYVVLTWVFMALSYNGFLQIRPAEALCILPLFYVEAVPALFVGCAIENLTSPFAVYDVTIGSAATLIAAIACYFIGKCLKKDGAKIVLGGLPSVLVNAFLIPVIIVFLCGDFGGQPTAVGAYFFYAASLAVTQCVWVYFLGTPLYFTVQRLQKRGLPYFL